MADYEGNGLAAFNDARSRGWSGSVTLADLEKLSAGNPIMQGIAAVWPDAPPSRADQAYQTSLDRWKQLGKDAFFAPANGMKAFNENPTFMNSLGVIPMGTFGGQLAKTADRAALANAQRMSAVGASREDIWTKTGWFQGVDGKWRFEIPDSGVKFRPTYETPTGDRQLHETVGAALDHPALRAAYPDLENIKMRYGNEFFDPKSGTGYYNHQNSEIGVGLSTGPRRDTSTLLHELQHATQAREGFARGSNASMSSDVYRRTAGEVEARAVERRMNLTPEQSRARYPWLDWDVPAEQQIVQMPSANNLSASMAASAPEKLKSAAVKYGDEIFEAPIHGIALDQAGRKYGMSVYSKGEHGFTTSTGRFVSRDEAEIIARAQDQLAIDNPGRFRAENLKPGTGGGP